MIIKLPLTVVLPRKKKDDKVIPMNLNWYRNAHHMILNNVKQAWVDIVRLSLGFDFIQFDDPEYLQTFIHPPFKFIYTVHKGDNRKYDVANICSIIDKFTSDSLVELGIIKDDNHKILIEVVYRAGAIDKEHPHCEVEIISNAI